MDKHAVKFIGLGIIATLALLGWLIPQLYRFSLKLIKTQIQGKDPSTGLQFVAFGGVLLSVLSGLAGLGLLGTSLFTSDADQAGAGIVLILVCLAGLWLARGLLRLNKLALWLSLVLSVLLLLLGLMVIISGGSDKLLGNILAALFLCVGGFACYVVASNLSRA